MQLPDVQQWLLYMLAALAVWWVVSRIRKRRAAKRAAQRELRPIPVRVPSGSPRGANRRPAAADTGSRAACIAGASAAAAQCPRAGKSRCRCGARCAAVRPARPAAGSVPVLPV